jgi:2,5-diketo-D-gluconate reductase B
MSSSSSIPKIGFGTWKRDGDECYRTVCDALEIGYRHIDTAEGYNNEEHVGRAIAESGVPRKDVFITTKVAPEHLGPGQIMPHVKISLEKLRVEKVDLLLLHWPSIKDQYDVNDYMAQFAAVYEAGLATYIGVSNFTKKYLDAAIRVLGKRAIATNQVECHVLLQNHVIVDYTKSKDIAITAYCPLARGELSNHRGLKKIAATHGTTTEQIGLAFLLAEGYIVIPSSSKRERIQSNWDAQKVTLSAAEMAAIRDMDEGRRLVNGAWCPVWDT